MKFFLLLEAILVASLIILKFAYPETFTSYFYNFQVTYTVLHIQFLLFILFSLKTLNVKNILIILIFATIPATIIFYNNRFFLIAGGLLYIISSFFLFFFTTPKKDTVLNPKFNALFFLFVFIFKLLFIYHSSNIKPTTLNDIGLRTIDATKLTLNFRNPYLQIENKRFHDSFHIHKQFYCYPPVSFLFHLPAFSYIKFSSKKLPHGWGKKIYLYTNFLTDLMCCLFLFLITLNLTNKTTAVISSLLYYTFPIIPHEVFFRGANDLNAIMLMLIGIYLITKQKRNFGKVLLLFGTLAKWIPGAFIFLDFINMIFKKEYKKSFIWFITYSLLTALILFPFMIHNPKEVINDLMWQFVRPIEDWEKGPFYIGSFSYIIVLLIMFYKPTSYIKTWIKKYYLVMALLLCTAKVYHINHFLWLIPGFLLVFSLNIQKKEKTIDHQQL